MTDTYPDLLVHIVETTLRPALPRARAIRATFATQEALYEAEHGDDEAFAHGIAPYASGEARIANA